MSTYHTPALLKASIDGLAIRPDGVYVDATFGGGGHSMEILSRLGPQGRLYAFDQDEDVFQHIPQDKRLIFVHGNFRFLKNFLCYHEETQIDGLLADLGVSSHHFDDAQRGFSFRFDAKLDMRMNRRADLKASDVLNTYSEDELTRVFRVYGELPQAKAMSALVVKVRQKAEIETIAQFVDILKPLFGREKEKKDMAKVFQALRIEVNHEMSALEALLCQSLEMLRQGGRLSIISYHSLEDRMVKNFMKSGNFEGKIEQDFFGNRKTPFRLVSNKVIVPTQEEQTENPRSRSAKLRIAEKTK